MGSALHCTAQCCAQLCSLGIFAFAILHLRNQEVDEKENRFL